ncbi:hypothetical protein KBJ98_14635 [Flavobacterium sp. F-328]|uniref:Uncharacterized protein n=1 Tax=Flavobacterium erciyesense TaxID=2825842 RepID=A0ABS5D7C7_9FLAO|nr:hypothetical protein [Flavobacterium erciyesense]MBQ0909947.1 hypothetical protein [Flavobacterium erciyesense]
MVKNNKILIVCVLLLGFYLFKNFLSKNMISGTYVSNNKQSLIDGPNFGDTLKIYSNDRFESQTWGNGKYKLKHSLTGTNIQLNYRFEFGEASYEMNIYRSFFSKPRINLDSDLEYYFEKID